MRHEWTDSQGDRWYAEATAWGDDFGRVIARDFGEPYDEEIMNGIHPIGPPAREIVRLAARVRELEDLVVPALEGQVARRIDRIAALEEETRRLRQDLIGARERAHEEGWARGRAEA